MMKLIASKLTAIFIVACILQTNYLYNSGVEANLINLDNIKKLQINQQQELRQKRSSDTNGKVLDWWQDAVFYQIYPRSFKDSDGDGVGDLKGITEKLQYLKDTGIDATWLSPIFKSPMVDFGYDISDYMSIQEEYGTMEDFENLIKEANRVGVKIILDFVPNHSSDQHEWFKKSVKREPGYENYYVWHPGKVNADGKREPPNNWISIFAGSAWEWNEERQEYYYHCFAVQQPDFNFHDPNMVNAMKEVLNFWMDKGVYGFRVDAVPHLVEQAHLKDEPLSGKAGITSNDWPFLNHIHTVNQPENYEIIHGWSETLKEYTMKNNNVTRIMMTEVYSEVPISLKYYDAGATFSFNFVLVNSIKKDSNAADIKRIIESWLLVVPDKYTHNWVMGNHDNDRIATACGREKIDAMNMILLFLPGIGVTYNGEEIGMENGHVTWAQHQDTICTEKQFNDQVMCRDFERTPFQWDDSHMAGFTNGNSPWLPVDPSYKEVNLKAQQAATESHYKVYQAMTKLRRTDTLRFGTTELKSLNNDKILVIERKLNNAETYFLISNTNSQKESINLKLSEKGNILVRSSNSKTYKVGDTINLNDISMGPYETYVIKDSKT